MKNNDNGLSFFVSLLYFLISFLKQRKAITRNNKKNNK